MGLVSRLRDISGEARRKALEELITRYWRPVYLFLRMAWKKSNEDAKDLAQAFFLWVVEEEETVRRYTPERGSFRTFLKVLLTRYVQDEERATRRIKRGGNLKVLPMEDLADLESAAQDPSTNVDEAYRRAWANEVMRHAVERVKARYKSRNRPVPMKVFERCHLTPAESRPSYAALATELGIKESDVRNHLYSVREAVREEIRAELSRMTTGEKEMQEEWDALFGA
jgi:RNA polymerase sigma factor (sigma-70 family)